MSSEIRHDPLELFYAYAYEDESLCKELDIHLSLLKREGFINTWNNHKLIAGANLENEIDVHLNSAHIILLLISPDFLASEYCYSVTMKRALERHTMGDARVIPIILRSVDWENAPFSKL